MSVPVEYLVARRAVRLTPRRAATPDDLPNCTFRGSDLCKRLDSDREVATLLAAIHRRIVRLVARQGIDLQDPSREAQAPDERQLDWPAYAEIQGAAVVGRVVTGPRAGRPVQRVGHNRYADEVTSTGPLHAHLDGFDLHAAVAVPAGDRKRLERLQSHYY